MSKDNGLDRPTSQQARREYTTWSFLVLSGAVLLWNFAISWLMELGRWIFGPLRRDKNASLPGGGYDDEKQLSIHFAGGGYLAAWYSGVMEFLIDNFDLEDVRFLGTSGGCSPLVCWFGAGIRPSRGINLHFSYGIKHWNSRWSGVAFDSTDCFRKIWHGMLESDGFARVSGNVELCVTKIDRSSWPPRFTPKRLSDFSSNEELVDAICCTQNVPGVFGTEKTMFRGEDFCDGAVGDVRPRVDENTVTVDALIRFAEVGPSRWFSPCEAGYKSSMEEMNQNILDGYKAAELAAKSGVFESRGWKTLPPAFRGTFKDLEARIARMACGEIDTPRGQRIANVQYTAQAA